MKQEYIENTKIIFTKLSNRRWFLDVLLLLCSIFAVLLIVALLSFNPSDPSWSQTAWHKPINNLCGAPGAWISDTLFFIFGVIAYSIPLIIISTCWFIYQRRTNYEYIDYFDLSLRSIGVLALILTSCALADINTDDIWYFASGGVIGTVLNTSLQPILHSSGETTIALLCIWSAGLTLFTGWSWIGIVEQLGSLTLNLFTFTNNRTHRHYRFVDNKEYDDEEDEQTLSCKKSYTQILYSWLLQPFRKRMPKKLINPSWRQTGATLFSSKNMYDPDEKANYSTQKQPIDLKDVLVSGKKPSFHISTKQQVHHAQEQLQTLAAADDNQKDPFFIANLPLKQQYAQLLMSSSDSFSLNKPNISLPLLDLLTSPPLEITSVDTVELEGMARLVEARLADFRIKADVVKYSPGPVITCFELNLAPGIKAARISNLSRDLARALSTAAVRVVEVIPGKPYVGLELPNKQRQTIYLREVLDCAKFRESPSPLTAVLGKDVAGDPVIADLAKMPHLLMAGTTGSGKSVGVNAMILSMLYKAQPADVRFIMIDPKMLELSVYEGIPHLLTKVVTDMKDAANALRWSVNEMERRYKLMSALGVRNLAGYNEKIEATLMGQPIIPSSHRQVRNNMHSMHPTLEKLPYIVVLVDEFADLMMIVGKKVEELIARLAQKARAAGIHLVLATQRPSVDVITGLIKANIPTRIAFTVSSKIDSRTILDQSGAESLLGMGDMLYAGPNSNAAPLRIHGAFVRDQEVHAVVQHWKTRGYPQYIEDVTSDSENRDSVGSFDSEEELDPLFDQAVNFVTEKQKASISGVQRQFRVGYNRAARIIEQMKMQGIVSEDSHNGNRAVLTPTPFI